MNALSDLQFGAVCRPDKTRQRRIGHPLSRKRFIRPGVQGRYMEKLTALLSQQIDKIWRADKGRQQPRRDLEWKQHHPPTPVSEYQQ
ncbi:Uncharacterised protein [Shigella sonnei]|nr:Uncharacterised protein [Shigella sonnei]